MQRRVAPSENVSTSVWVEGELKVFRGSNEEEQWRLILICKAGIPLEFWTSNHNVERLTQL
jgi:hypothetical protein